MTTDTKTLPVATRLPGFNLRRFLIAFGVTLVVLLTLASAAAFAYARMNDGRILPGVTVAGVDVAGLTPQQATDKLRAALPDVSAGTLTLKVGTVEQRIGYSEIGRHYGFAQSIDGAMSVGRDGNPIDQFAQQLRTFLGGVDLTPSVSYDSQALADRVAAAVATAQVTPVNAAISFKNGEYVVTPAADGQSVDGAEALRQAIAALNNPLAEDTVVTVAAVAIPAEISTPDAEAAIERAIAVTESPLYLSVGSTSETISSQTLRGWVRLEETGPGTWDLVVERGPIDQLVALLKSETDQPAVDAEFRFEGGEPVAVAGQTGYELAAVAAGDMIHEALSGRANGSVTDRLTLPVNATVPAFTTEQAQALVSQVELLGTWTTRYVPSKANSNGQNIRRPAELINGYVVQPGDVFDFVGVAGPISKANGYGDGAAIIHGKTRGEGVLGGGLCSASTTMFNAALRAGFEIGARRNHAYYIDRYPVGLDATIWISGSYVQTMTFTNDGDYPIVIRGINKRKSVTFEIWGVPDGRTVSLSDADVTNIKKAGNFYQFTDELGPREMERTEYAADGFNSVVVRTVRDANGTIIHQDTIRSNYRKVDGIILVGRAPGDPVAGTRIPVSQGLPPINDPDPTPTPTPDPTDPPADTVPVAKFSVTEIDSDTFRFAAKGKNLTYEWTIDGNPAGSQKAFQMDFTPGPHSVTLVVTDADGDPSAPVSQDFTATEPAPPEGG